MKAADGKLTQGRRCQQARPGWLPFAAAGLAVGCAETAENSAIASLAPAHLRGSAFGLLATILAAGNLAASAVAGVLWTAISPRAAFIYLTAWMLLALAGLAFSARRPATGS